MQFQHGTQITAGKLSHLDHHHLVQERPSTIPGLIEPGRVFVSVFSVYGAVTGRRANIVTATTPAAPYLRAVWLRAMQASADLIAKTLKLRLSLLGKPCRYTKLRFSSGSYPSNVGPCPPSAGTVMRQQSSCSLAQIYHWSDSAKSLVSSMKATCMLLGMSHATLLPC